MGLIFILGAIAILFAIELSKRTDRLIKEEDMIAKQIIEEGHRRTQQMIDEGNKRLQRMIEQSNERTEKMIKYIAMLISSEGEKTRELINSMKED